jgi:hypothetical protein
MRGSSERRRDYDVAGFRLALSSRRDDLLQLLERRLARYRATGATATPDLEVHYVDDLPPRDDAAPAGTLRTVYEPGGGLVRHAPESDTLHAEVRGASMHADLRRGVARIAGGSWSGAQRYVAVHTLTTLVLMEALKRRGRFALHAGCLARDGRAVLVAGKSGAGKSTLALALADCGLDYLSDDLVFLRPGAGGPPKVLGFADAVGVSSGTVRLIPGLAAACASETEPGFPKHLVRVEHLFPNRIVAASQGSVLVFPEIAATDHSEIEPMDPGEAWLRLVPDVLLTDEASSRAHLSAIASLTGHVSCHRLRSGRDLKASARLVCGLL